VRHLRSPRLMALIAATAVTIAGLETAFLVHDHLTSIRVPISAGTPQPADCVPGDQDPYVYSPSRLRVLSPCLRMTGTVRGISVEHDGDRHLNVELDPQYESLLTPGNEAQFNRLVVEPICVGGGDEPAVAAECATDPDPIEAIPEIGERVWFEGRYVLDSNHFYWAELHPLYRWGVLP
jgi:hypothetical protein